MILPACAIYREWKAISELATILANIFRSVSVSTNLLISSAGPDIVVEIELL